MRIACPSCAATYEVPEARLKPGKMVRCAKCGGEWVPEREPDRVVAEAPVPTRRSEDNNDDHDVEHGAETSPVRPQLSAMDRLAAPPPPSPRPRSLIGAWIATAVVIVAAVSATIIWRHEFMSVWPPSSRILAPFGQELPKPERIPGNKAG